jgi:diadenosine tetraphosphate (Ap4A) HIT family hydrolase
MTAEQCFICERIALIKKGESPYFVAELRTGYVVIGDHQLFPGYTLFLAKEHKEELHELGEEESQEFLVEMSIVAKSVSDAFRPDKLNYELLGNGVRHMHWHIFPRYKRDAAPGKPIWVVPREEREKVVIGGSELIEMKKKLNEALKRNVPAL